MPRPSRTRPRAHTALAAGVACLATGCAWLPGELNFSPLYRHRLDEQGNVLEMDVLWPIVHYETTASGGVDFRIRPLYRYVTETAEENVVPHPASEHQFLWPFGRVRSDAEQTIVRLFPLFSHTDRLNEAGQRESDWYLAFPFIWGGSRDDGAETYFGIVPLYLDAPQFFVYDRFTMVLWPLYLGLEKDGKTSHFIGWPLGGFGYGEDGSHWHKLLPLWSVAVSPELEHYAVLWPFISWGTAALDTADPISRFLLWPLFGWQRSESVLGWTILWPLFRRIRDEGRLIDFDFLWPFYRYFEDWSGVERTGDELGQGHDGPFRQWWLWPLVARTDSPFHRAWSFLWPLVWWREYLDPEGTTTQQWVLPFFWHAHRAYDTGANEDHVKVWPLAHRTLRTDEDGRPERGDWRAPSIWPWSGGNARGVHELYGFLWTLVEGQLRAPDDDSMQLVANLFTTRERAGRRQTSVPFLFNYEGDDRGGTLRLLQFIPIPWFGSSAEGGER